MKKTTKKTLLTVLIMGALSQAALQAMDQHAPQAAAQAEDPINYSVLAPLIRGLNRLTGRQIVDVTPRIEQQAQNALPADQANQDHSTNSVILNACNETLALSQNTARIIAGVPLEIRNELQNFNRRYHALDYRQRLIFKAIVTSSITSIVSLCAQSANVIINYEEYLIQTTHGATHHIPHWNFLLRLLTEWRPNDLRVAIDVYGDLFFRTPLFITSAVLLSHALHIAESYNPQRELPPAAEPAFTRPATEPAFFARPANNAPIIPVLNAPNTVEGECSVCLDTVAIGDGSQAVNCNHVYHTDCIVRWITQQAHEYQQPSCPLCRTHIDVR